jgi:hypothetical protein
MDLGTPTRANTNAWWGGHRKIRIGDQEFATDEGVVDALRETQLGMLALSIDNRYDQYPELLGSLIRVASLCESAQQPYEIIVTDPRSEIVMALLKGLKTTLDNEPRYLNLTPMETVDLGAAALQNRKSLDSSRLADLATTSPCGTRGFHRPYYLHVAPDGGVRSCMYAPNGAWHGNIIHQRLSEILNTTPGNPVYRLFESKNLAPFIEKYIAPWQHLYTGISHGCTASALIARVAEEVWKDPDLRRTPTRVGMEVIHGRISSDYHLAAME